MKTLSYRDFCWRILFLEANNSSKRPSIGGSAWDENGFRRVHKLSAVCSGKLLVFIQYNISV